MARRKVKNGDSRFFAPFFSARLVFLLPPLSAPGSPRMDRNKTQPQIRKTSEQRLTAKMWAVSGPFASDTSPKRINREGLGNAVQGLGEGVSTVTLLG